MTVSVSLADTTRNPIFVNIHHIFDPFFQADHAVYIFHAGFSLEWHATVSNINGKRKAVILCTDKKNVLYQHLEHKGHDGLTKTPVKNFDGILIHDHDKSYYSYGSKHQEYHISLCLS